VLAAVQLSVFIVTFSSNQDAVIILVVMLSQLRGLVIGKMQHKYLENMWVKLIACIIALDNIVRILETKGKVWTM